ncbi:hypothetical protein FA13DRAFT_1728999 [Coprinellus micaceus]|uniref:Transmembrane protein n=1 Tax=Coprinellus micaceus TaxID=71717 RepID=A0A4Y7TMK8_COPMI|nr:hypothetical protein FA13DRAFT_1728999 [Coprinellus micaceus]
MVAPFYLLSFLSLFCDDLTVEWLGGTGPFSLLIVPVFGVQRNVTIPDSAFSGGKGSYTMKLQLAKERRFVLTMSDSTGFAAGGTTEVMLVGASSGASCDTADPAIAFPFQLNSALQQCRAFAFTGYQSAVQPVTIWMVVPGGTSQIVRPGAGSSYSWTANVAAGTSMIFMMTDGRGGAGGASDLLTVGASDASSSIETAPPAATTKSDGVPISAIAGTVIGSLLFLAVIFRKSRRMPSDGTFFGGPPPSNPYGSPPTGVPQYYPYTANSNTALDNPFADGTATPMNDLTPAQSQFALQQSSDPFQAPPVRRSYYPPSPSLPPMASQDPFNPTLPGAIAGAPIQSQETSSSQRKAAMAGVTSYTPSRFIVHTDADDELPPPDEDGVVELPPQYTERRTGPKRKLSVMNPSRPSADSVLQPDPAYPPPPTNPSYSNVSPFS